MPAIPVEEQESRSPHPNQPTELGTHDDAVQELLASAELFAEEVAGRPNHGATDAPHEDLRRMQELKLFTAPLPRSYGGLGLGVEESWHLPLLKLLSIIGGASLVLGRLFEGHVNALILIAAYGEPRQIRRAAEDASRGLLFGVWNTGEREPLRLKKNEQTQLVFEGGKTFASGAPFVGRPIVTAEWNGWQMTLPRMEDPRIARSIQIDPSFWHPLGMEASQSYGIRFSGAAIESEDLIGSAGDFYENPLFQGGAIRFAAVHAGAVLRLQKLFANWLESNGRGTDPYQVARLGEITLAAQEAVLWIERAASIAEEGLSNDASRLNAERMVAFANMTRLAIERIATSTMRLVIAGVGAHGLLQPSPFERIIRDLTMYLRQPAPDQTLAEVGRSAQRSGASEDRASQFFWSDTAPGSLPPHYFEQIYKRSPDPWNFETSEYEAKKYGASLASLPRTHYEHALEIGCSIGVFTHELAARCDSLLALDVSEKALSIARTRCAMLSGVQFQKMQVPKDFPNGTFDLIVVSEVAYYWGGPDLKRAINLIAEHQPVGGHLLLVHFTIPVPDYPLTGDQVHRIWRLRNEWTLIREQRAEKYRIDVFERNV